MCSRSDSASALQRASFSLFSSAVDSHLVSTSDFPNVVGCRFRDWNVARSVQWADLGRDLFSLVHNYLRHRGVSSMDSSFSSDSCWDRRSDCTVDVVALNSSDVDFSILFQHRYRICRVVSRSCFLRGRCSDLVLDFCSRTHSLFMPEASASPAHSARRRRPEGSGQGSGGAGSWERRVFSVERKRG